MAQLPLGQKGKQCFCEKGKCLQNHPFVEPLSFTELCGVLGTVPNCLSLSKRVRLPDVKPVRSPDMISVCLLVSIARMVMDCS